MVLNNVMIDPQKVIGNAAYFGKSKLCEKTNYFFKGGLNGTMLNYS